MRWRVNRLLFVLSILAVGGGFIPGDLHAMAQEAPATPQAETADKPDAKPAAEQPPARERLSRGQGRPSEGPDSRLDRIEKQLLEISKSLQGMQKESAKPSAPANVDKPSTEPASKESPAKEAPADEKKEWDGVLSKEWLKGIRWRNVGPANMGGRIVDLAVNENSPSTWWAATASGGLLKTTNNGISFEMQFDKEATVSIGAVAVSKSNPDVVWVGTGENNPRNSVSYGDGVYKSTDGGKTWKNMGLKKTFQIGEIVVHPTDPNTVYVGALGRLYGSNEERGVYKTTDGGETWERCFYLDDRTGIMEMQMHPTDPNTLIVTAWERLRDGFDSWPGNEVPIPEGYDGYDPIRKWGPASGIYKTTDAGKNWKKLTNGLPTGQLGRIGIDWYRKDPNIIFAIVDSENTGKGPQPLNVNWGAVGADVDGKIVITQVYPKSPAQSGGLMTGDVVVAMGEQELKSFDEILDSLRKKKGGDTVSLTVQRGDEKKTLEFKLTSRGGRAGATPQQGVWFGGIGEDVDQGVKMTQVNPESPAGKASLQVDDILVEFDGQPAKAWTEVVSAVTSKKAGDKVKVKFLRDDETKELEMTLENRPTPPGSQQPAAPARTYVGFQGTNAEKGGALLTEITADGPAEKAGLMKGDVVKGVNKKSIGTYRDLTTMLAELNVGDKLTFEVARATEIKEFEVVAAERPAPVRPYTASLGGQAANVQDQQGAKGFEYGGVYKSTDGGETWTRLNSVHSRPMYFSVIRVDPNDDQKIYLLGVSQFKSVDGGVTFDESLGRSVHADGHSLWVDPKDGNHMIIGVDGGVYVTYDQGRNWDHLNTLPIGQFYHVAISPKYPYYLYGGLQDNGTWGGPALSLSGRGPVNEDWVSVGGGDGFMCRVDPNDPDLVYWTSQNGAMGRRNMKTGERASIRPRSIEGQPAYRFNWNTPFILSSANSRVFYAAGNYVFRSMDRGANLEKISPEITLTKRGSATALSESPLDSNVLYVGTDDGALWVTKDGGKSWSEIGKGLNLPAPRWVATVEASRFAPGRVYVSLDGHRSNDDEAYAFVSEDFGATWKSIRSNLPWGSTRCLRESPFNENVLLVGTEFHVFASADRGGTWNSLNTNLPTVPVFDFAFHPNNGEVVAATHGRSLWIADITPLNQFAAQQTNAAAHLYKPLTAIRWRREPSRGGTNRSYAGENPPSGAILYYSISKKAKEAVVRVANAEGQTIREIRGPVEPGLHRVVWDLISSPPARPRGESGRGEAGAGGRGESGTRRGAGGGGGGGRATAAPSGTYKVTLTVDGKELSHELRLVSDPNVAALNDLLGTEAEYDVWLGDEVSTEEEEEEENEGVQSGLRERIHD
ncbi:PDZ domain-containing protein [Pirellulaceae bacterium SH467]